MLPSCMGLQPLRYFSEPAFPLCTFFEYFYSTAPCMPVFWHVFLQDARHAAEAEIYTSLNAKIDQFLQLADYDWLVSTQGDNTEASDYLIDLIAFLKSTFSVFTNLPVSKHAAQITNLSLSLCRRASIRSLNKSSHTFMWKKVYLFPFHYNTLWQHRWICPFVFFLTAGVCFYLK